MISSQSWIVDSGASMHFTHDQNNFAEYEPIKTKPVQTAAKGNPIEIVGKGTVFISHEVEGRNGQLEQRVTHCTLFTMFPT